MAQVTSTAATFAVGISTVDLHQLQQLFNIGSFWARHRPLDKLQRMLLASAPVVSAYIDGQLVGFARATSDGVFRATIWDVVVHPEFQGQGLGRRLVEVLLEQPELCHVERVYLMTTFQQGFYEKLGFACNTSTTMVLLRPEGGEAEL